jgi:hypothetical protein
MLLQVAQRSTKRSRDPKVLNDAMAKLPGTDSFCICELQLVGEEVFRFQKRKINDPLRFEDGSHWPDTINFSHSWIATRFARANHASYSLANVVEELSLDLQEDHAPNNLGTTVEVCKPPHITAVQETACDKLR